MKHIDLHDYCSKYNSVIDWTQYLTDNAHDSINIAYLNVSSLKKHFSEILVQFKEAFKYIDVLIFSEINLKSDVISMYQLLGYETYAVCRDTRRGGGVLMYVRDTYTFKRETLTMTSCEYVAGSIVVRGVQLYLLAVYRPPSPANVSVFVRELKSVVDSVSCDQDIIIIGDVNINSLNMQHAETLLYEDMLSECKLLNVINDVTREEIRDGRFITSCLDHILIKQSKPSNFSSNVVRCGISDHHLVCINIISREKTQLSTKLTKSVLNNTAVQFNLRSIDWSELLKLKCPLQIYEKMCLLFSDVYKNNMVTIRIRHTQHERCAWITKEISNSIKHRDKLYKLWKSSPNDMVKRLEYTRFRNKTSKLICKSQNDYKKQIIKDYGNNYKKIWECVNKWLGRTRKSVDEVILRSMGDQYDLPTICNNFVSTFAEEVVLLKAHHNCNKNLLKREDYTRECNSSMRFIEVTSTQVEKIILQLDCGMSPGVDQIRAIDLKEIRSEISPVIAKMINLFIHQSKYPDQLKMSIIRPIFKSGNHKEPTNYRPISILSCINKVVEKAINGQISDFLAKHQVVSQNQFGFQKGKNTSLLLSQFSNIINNHLNNKKHVGVIFIDFRKAFDTLEHQVLLKSMESCGLRGKINAWFKQYLTNRKIMVKVGDCIGNCEVVKYGVATGSVTGPACYTMHVNSMVNVVKSCDMFMFADDTCILYGHEDLSVVQAYLQQDFDNITRWAHDNGIILNVKKTNIMHICSSHRKRDKETMLAVQGHSYDCLHYDDSAPCGCQLIQQVEACKYLGVVVDNKFNWERHVNHLLGKLRLLLFKFNQLKYCVPRSVLYSVYFALVDSIIDYGIVTYGSTFNVHINKIKQLQLRFVKMLVSEDLKNKAKANYETLFKKCNILPVDKKFLLKIAKEAYWQDKFKIKLKGKVITRQVLKGKFFVPRVNNFYGKRTKEYLVPKLFNSMSDATKNVMPYRLRVRDYTLKKYFLGLL